MSKDAPMRLGVGEAEPVGGAAAVPAPFAPGVLTIDRRRHFVCPSAIPLAHAPIWNDLSEAHRRRCGQLFAMYMNELVAYFEGTFVAGILVAARRAGHDPADAALAARLERFAEDERRHRRGWIALNRASDAALYGRGERCFLRMPAWLRLLTDVIVRHPDRFPLVYWIMLAVEERSMTLSRRTLRLGPTILEEHYRAIHEEHLVDEARHVQLDRELIDRSWGAMQPRTRRWWGVLLGKILGERIVRPGASNRRIIGRLVEECPELRPLRQRMFAQLGGVHENAVYRASVFSEESTPLLWRALRRWPEMAGVTTRLCPDPATVTNWEPRT